MADGHRYKVEYDYQSATPAPTSGRRVRRITPTAPPDSFETRTTAIGSSATTDTSPRPSRRLL
ncbi:hypothetical protein [Streptomyces yanii]|uniref:hypothetical protein n=1 Tax=Streptomyces yanii TaxID=78510 RepID=UPI0031E7819F